MPKTDITVELSGQDGNAFAILGAVSKAMRRGNIEKAIIDEFMAEATSGDYDHMLRTVMKYVNVEGIRERRTREEQLIYLEGTNGQEYHLFRSQIVGVSIPEAGNAVYVHTTVADFAPIVKLSEFEKAFKLGGERAGDRLALRQQLAKEAKSKEPTPVDFSPEE